MSDLISRAEAIDAIKDEWDECLSEYDAQTIINDTVRRIEALPSAQPMRKKGKWKMLPSGNALCSECGYMQVHAWDAESWDNYCHHCGADMRGDKDEN